MALVLPPDYYSWKNGHARKLFRLKSFSSHAVLRDGFEHFQSLDKHPLFFGSEQWEDKFASLLDLVKGFSLDV
jgi:hypothetical protein